VDRAPSPERFGRVYASAAADVYRRVAERRWFYLSARDSERQMLAVVTGAALEGLPDPALEAALGERFATRPAGS